MSITTTLQLNGGVATYARNDRGEWDLTGWQAPQRSRFSHFRGMARVLREKGFVLEKSTWADGWQVKTKGDFWIRWTLYLGTNNKWNLYDVIGNAFMGVEIDDEVPVRMNCNQYEIVTYFLFQE